MLLGVGFEVSKDSYYSQCPSLSDSQLVDEDVSSCPVTSVPSWTLLPSETVNHKINISFISCLSHEVLKQKRN